jgi:hypothetical protein
MSEKRIVVSAPMSLNGAYLRTINFFWADKPLWFKASLGWVLVPGILVIWWTVIAIWYWVFGLLLAPYRLVRRGGRKRKVEERRHQEILQAMNNPKSSSSLSTPGVESGAESPESFSGGRSINYLAVVFWALIIGGGLGLLYLGFYVVNERSAIVVLGILVILWLGALRLFSPLFRKYRD